MEKECSYRMLSIMKKSVPGLVHIEYKECTLQRKVLTAKVEFDDLNSFFVSAGPRIAANIRSVNAAGDLT